MQTDLQQIADALSAAGLDHPAVDDAVIKLTNWAARPLDEVALAEVIQDHTGCGDSDSIYAAHAVIQHIQAAHPSRGVVDEVAERRALNKALDALDALSERWASEIGLDAMCANLAKAADVPAAIRAMAVQAWVEGAYAGRTSHQAAALPAVPEGESVTLTVAQIADLAAFAGLTLAAVPELGEDERAAEITVCTCPDKGVLLDGEDSDPGVIAHYAHIAYYSEYPGEGCIGLGPEIAATPKDQPAQGEG